MSTDDADRIKSTSFVISAEGVSNLPSGCEIIVSALPSGEGFVLINEEGAMLPYGIYRTEQGGDSLEAGAAIAEFTSDGNATGWILVDQSLITQGGSYKGILKATPRNSQSAHSLAPFPPYFTKILACSRATACEFLYCLTKNPASRFHHRNCAVLP